MSLRMIWTSLAVVTCVSLVACGFDAEPAKQPAFPAGGSASVLPTAGTGTVAGSFGTAGDTAAGGGGGTAGTGFGTAGTETGGTASAGTGTGGTGGTGTAGSGTAGTGGAPVVCPAANPEAPLPLVVSVSHAPSGYFPATQAAAGSITAGTCEARPAENTVGTCYKYTFKAAMLEGDGAYGGVFWQYGVQNWGQCPGMKVAAGATKVTFKAWGAVGGEVVTFSAGGMGGMYPDGVNLGTGGGEVATLTTTPTLYTIDLMGQTYPNGISGGFSWSTATTSIEQSTSFYVDEIQWVQ